MEALVYVYAVLYFVINVCFFALTVRMIIAALGY